MDRRGFERVGGKTVFDGPLISVRVDRFRFADGEEVERVIVEHPGAVAVVAHHEDAVVLVRQPREAIDDRDSLELPAGTIDGGEDPLATGMRELAEEVGLSASDWELLTSYRSSPGVMNEQVFVYLATGLADASTDKVDDERIEVVRWPLADLDGAIAATSDAKTIIGLMLLRDRVADAIGDS